MMMLDRDRGGFGMTTRGRSRQVLMGDQMQLAAPSEGRHPGRIGLSCLEYLLGGVAVVPPGRGLFLPTTH
jgi:uncharacterized protein